MRLLQALKDRFDGSWPAASLRTYFVGVILLATLPVAALMSLQIFTEVRNEEARTRDELSRSAAALAQAVARELASSLDALELLARSDVVRGGQAARLGQLLHWRPRRDWDSVFMLAPDGTALLDTESATPRPAQPGAPLRELHQRVLQTRRPGVSALPIAQASGRRTIVLAVPVIEAGVVRYILGARLRESVWQQLAATASAPAGAHASLIDTQGQLLGDSPSAAAEPREAAREPHSGVQRTVDADGRPVYDARHEVPMAQWHVRVAAPAAPIDAARRRAIVAALATSGGGLLLGLLLAAMAARRVARPLHQLATRGPAALPERVAVHEVALLRDALLRARAQDGAAPDALEARAQEFRTLFNSSPIGMAFARDPACRAIWHNAAMDTLIGSAGSHRAGTVRVLHEGRVLAPGQQPLQRAAALGETVTGLELEIAIDGRPSTFVIANAAPLRDAGGRPRGAISALVDITDQKQSERARALLTERALAARREAEAASRAKDEFLTMLSHELRNPLGAISAAVEVLDAAKAGDSNALEARAIIGRQTRNLAHMMNDLLDVGRVIAGKILLARQGVNLATVVQRVHETLALTGEAKDHRMQLELQDAWVDGDAVRIEQVVTNLLTNALKYTPRGGSIQVTVRLDDGSAVLQVQDSGVGIPPALLPRIFDLFVQGERPLHRPAGGLGIGLTLVRRLVELHGGTVSADSSSAGSRFTVRLPAVAAPSAPDANALRPSRRRNVLVVEDNDDVLAALRSKLELDGHTVSTAADGAEGLTRLLKLKPEISIVDIGLPGLTGFELARHARAAGYAGRMIALSGYGAERDAHAALVAGFDAYLVKPVDRNELRASLSAE